MVQSVVAETKNLQSLGKVRKQGASTS